MGRNGSWGGPAPWQLLAGNSRAVGRARGKMLRQRMIKAPSRRLLIARVRGDHGSRDASLGRSPRHPDLNWMWFEGGVSAGPACRGVAVLGPVRGRALPRGQGSRVHDTSTSRPRRVDGADQALGRWQRLHLSAYLRNARPTGEADGWRWDRERASCQNSVLRGSAGACPEPRCRNDSK